MGEIIEHEDELQELSHIKHDIRQGLETVGKTNLKAI